MSKGLREHPLLVTLFLFALIARIYFEVVYVDFGMDKGHQLFITQCFQQGHGFSYFTASLSDLSTSTAELNRFWAIGFPLLVAAIDTLVGNLVLSSVLLDVVGVFVLLWGFHLLLTRLQVGARGYGAFLVFTGLSITPYYYLGSTDFLSAALWVLAIALSLERLGEERASPVRFAVIGLVVFLACFLRYAYYPFLVILPGVLGAVAFLRRDRRILLGGAVVLASSVIPMACLLLFYRHYFGSALYVKGEAAWYPRHLLRMAPFPLDALVYTRLFQDNLQALGSSLSLLFRVVAGALSVAILGVIAGHFLELRRRPPEDERAFLTRCFHGFLGATLLMNVAIFAWYSLKNPTPHGFPEGWSYVEENRYYAPTILLLQVALVAACCQDRAGSRFVRWGAGLALGAGLLFATSYGAYRFVKVHFLGVPTLYAARYDRTSELVALIDELRSEGKDVVQANGYSPHDCSLVAIRTDARVVLDYDSLLAGEPRCSRPLVLLVTMPKEKRPMEERFLAAHSARRVIDRERFDTWRIDLEPSGGR